MTDHLPVIDAHLHLWDRSRSPYGWLGPEFGVLNENHLPDRIGPVLAQLGVRRAVLVQADDTVDDTAAMVEMAQGKDWIAGVVGWVRLDEPQVAAEQLDRWAAQPVVRGIRHLVHDDPRADFVDLPPVQESLGLVADRGLSLDLPDAWPGGFAGRIAGLADRHPGLTIVVDHLAKPPHGGPDFASWAAMLRDVAARPNVVAKVSGLADATDHQCARESGDDAVPQIVARWRPAWEVALAAFGPDRLMYGSDWPITRLGLDYAGTWAALQQLIGELSASEQMSVLAGTASRTYRLDP